MPDRVSRPGQSGVGRAPDGPRDALSRVLEPVVAGVGLELEGVEVSAAGRRSVVRVLVDRDGGVTLDDVAEASRVVSDALDALDGAEPGLLAGAYVLEVGSPGVDRPLTAPRHWRRSVGRLVAVTRREGEPLTGRVVSASDAEDGEAVLGVGDAQVAVRYADVQRALVQVEFSRPGGDPLAEEDA